MTRRERVLDAVGGRLFLRIYLYGLTLLATVAVAAVVLMSVAFVPQMNRQMGGFSRWVAEPLLAAVGEPSRAARIAEDLRRGIDLRVVLYDASGRAIASTAASTPAPLTAEERNDLAAGRVVHRGPPFPLLVGNAAGWVALAPPEVLTSLRSPALGLAVVMVVLALLSVLLARSIAAPLSRLRTVARALGQGDLSVRTQMSRADEVGDVAREVDQMADRIASMRRAEKELLANVSHELRTPLARVRVALELASDGGDPTEVRRYVTQINEDIGELETLLDDIITAARFDLAHVGDAFPAVHLVPTAPAAFHACQGA